jgi:hypothetical protein
MRLNIIVTGVILKVENQEKTCKRIFQHQYCISWLLQIYVSRGHLPDILIVSYSFPANSTIRSLQSDPNIYSLCFPRYLYPIWSLGANKLNYWSTKQNHMNSLTQRIPFGETESYKCEPENLLQESLVVETRSGIEEGTTSKSRHVNTYCMHTHMCTHTARLLVCGRGLRTVVPTQSTYIRPEDGSAASIEQGAVPEAAHDIDR